MKQIAFFLITVLTCFMANAQKVDHYAGKESVVFNGVTWKIKYDSDLDGFYFIRPTISKYGYADTRYKDKTKVPYYSMVFPEMTNTGTPRNEAAKTYRGHLEKLRGAILYIDCWINTETGRVEDVAFGFSKASPLTEFDISYLNDLHWRIRTYVTFRALTPTKVYDGFVLMGFTVLFKGMTVYPV